MRIVGVDPGVNTGFCLIEFIPKPLFYHIVDSQVLRGTTKEVVNYITAVQADFYVIEQWLLVTLYAQEVSHRDPHQLTVRVIGGLEVALPPDKIIFQPPASKKYTPDDKLRELHLWDQSKHVNDAYRHVVFFSRRFLREQYGNKKIDGLLDLYD